MAPKKKHIQEWNECKVCRGIVYKGDIEAHTTDCTITHGFIKDGVFYAQVLNESDKLKQLSQCYDELVVFLNPSTMKLCQLGAGQPCLINNTYVLTCRPCTRVPATSILPAPPICRHILATQSDNKPLATVQRFFPLKKEAVAVEVELQLSEHTMNMDEFLKMLKCKLENHYIKEGTTYSTHFYGQLTTLQIKAIQQCELHNDVAISLCALSQPTNLWDSMASLDISEQSDMGESQNPESSSCLSSTPLKQPNSEGKCESPCLSPVCTPSNPDREINSSNAVANLSKSSLQTPEKVPWSRPEQFCTPALEAVQSMKPFCSNSSPFVKVTPHTKFVQKTSEKEKLLGHKKVTFDSIGGLQDQIAQIKKMCIMPLTTLRSGNQLDIPLEKGILLCGPPGTGKALLAEAIVNELGINTIHISPMNFYCQYMGDAGEKLKCAFSTACTRAPSIVIISQLEVLCPAPSPRRSDGETQRVNLFCSVMDQLYSQSYQAAVIVVGITSKLDALDPELLKLGRFGTKIDIPIPTADEREEIIHKLLENVNHGLSNEEIKNIANNTHAFVGDDLFGMVIRAKDISKSAVISKANLRQAAKEIRPSAMKEAKFELYIPQVRWSDIGGLESLKLRLRQMVEWPLLYRDVFDHFGLKMTGGLLMYGPPGCSKTMIARALAGETRLNFFAVKGPELLSKYVGESERVVRELFNKARSAAPAIIFFDEIDSIAVERGASNDKGSSSVCHGVLTQLLTEIDGFVDMKNIIIIAATNRPDKIDMALLRPGRLSQVVYVPLPDAATRRAIMAVLACKTPLAPDVSIDALVDKTERFSGAELTQMFQRAAYLAIGDSGTEARVLHRHHFYEALQLVHPQTTPEMIKFYENYYTRLTSAL